MTMKIISLYKELPQMLEFTEKKKAKDNVFLDKLIDKLKKLAPLESTERVAASAAIIAHYIDFEHANSHDARISLNRMEEYKIEEKLIEYYKKCESFAPKNITVYVSISNAKHKHLKRIKGVSGVTDQKNILLFIWPYQGWHQKVLDVFVHELAHAARMPRLKGKLDLLEYIISEGISQHVVREITGTENRMRVPSEMKIWNLYKQNFTVTNKKNLHKLVFGDGKKIHFMAGYFMGYRIVQNYLNKTGKKPTEILYTSAREILDVSDYSKK